MHVGSEPESDPSEHGIPDDTVQSYAAVEKQCEPHGRAEWCDYNLTAGCQPLGHHDQPPHSTEPPTAYPLYGVSEFGGVSGVERMKAEIFARGPISCGIVASRRFTNHSGGHVLELATRPGAKLDHEVSVYGWGVEQGKAYWRVRNSYGSAWGEHGHVRISQAMSGGLDTDCSWGVPTVNSSAAQPGQGTKPVVMAAAVGQRRRRVGGALAPPTQPRRPSVVLSPLPQDYIADEDVPESYDTSDLLGKDYTTVSRSQNIPHACGSCWIQASVCCLRPDQADAQSRVPRGGAERAGCAGLFQPKRDHTQRPA